VQNPGVPLIDDTQALGILVTHFFVLCSVACATSTIYIRFPSVTRHHHLLANACIGELTKIKGPTRGASSLFALKKR